ncbi:MAG: class II aldolase/adducin family protein [Myxococcota bacterium]
MHPPDVPAETALRRTMVDLCHRLHAQGLLVALDGNLSARLPSGHILCTKAGTHKAFVQDTDLVVTDAEGQWLRGLGKPTSELALHLACYKSRPDINAIIHAHPPSAIACTLAGVDLDRPLLPEVVLTLGTVPTVPYATTGSKALALATAAVAVHRDGILLDKHGAVALGTTLIDAFCHLETIEQLARITLDASALGPVPSLPHSEAVRLRSAGLKRYGGPPASVVLADQPNADLRPSSDGSS